MMKPIKMRREKKNIVHEMLTTENTYNQGLGWLIKWKTELDEKGILTTGEINNLFSTVIDNIKNMSDIFLEDIKAIDENWTSDSEIGGIYNKIAPFFSMYVDYCNNNEKAGTTLADLLQKSKLIFYVIDSITYPNR